MIPGQRSKKTIIFILIVALLLVAGVAYILWPTFALPPSEEALNPWQTMTDKTSGYTFSYPVRLPTKYTKAFDWPPKLQIVDTPFTCREGSKEIERAGETIREQVENRPYCITKVVEGAAGSTYTQYAYAFPKANKTFIFTFSIQEVQCANYSEPESIACKEERYFFSLDTLVDTIAQTLSIKQ